MLGYKIQRPDIVAETEKDRKQIVFATMTTINGAAYDGMKAVQKEIESVFDRPTRWVVGGVRYTKARKDKLSSTIDLDYWGNKQGVAVEKILQAQVFSGARRLKRFEVALNKIKVLPDGYAVVPGARVELDAHGNMPAGLIVQVLAFFRAFGEQGYKSNMTDKTTKKLAKGSVRAKRRGLDYVLMREGNRSGFPPGIYRRQFFGFGGSSLEPIMIFIPIPSYRRRLDFYGLAEQAVQESAERRWPEELARAFATAR